MKKILLSFLFCFAALGLWAQSGEIQGLVTDPVSGETLPFATVSVELNGSLIGATTDFDGRYSLKPLPPGKYTLTVSFIGYQTQVITDVIVYSDRSAFVDVSLSEESELLTEVQIVAFKNPLIQTDVTSTGGTKTREEIATLPTRDVKSIASTTAGVFQGDEGGDVNVKGARNESTDYYVDGIKVRGSSSIPAQAIEQVDVITGGTPAKYGDATGGIINITTRGPSSKLGGTVEYLTSELTDPYGYNLFSGIIGGPLLKANKGEKNERTILGFSVTGQFLSQKDDFPSAFPLPRVKDEVRDEIIQNPLIANPSGGGFIKTADFLTEDDFDFFDTHEGLEKTSISGTAKLQIQPVKNVDITIGFTGNYDEGGQADRSASFKDFFRRFDVLSYDRYPEITEQTYRGFVRFTQRFNTGGEEGDDKSSFLSNAYYSIQADYTKSTYNRYDPLHKDNYFDAGFVGKFTQGVDPFYSQSPLQLVDADGVPLDLRGVDNNILNIEGRRFEGFTPTSVSFEPGESNPISVAYNEKYFELAGKDQSLYRTIFDVIGNGGLWNGTRTASSFSVYNIYYMPGFGSNFLDKTENDQYRLVFNASVDLKKPDAPDRNKHAIEFGFEYEQRVDRRYRLNYNQLYDRMRRQASRPGQGIELDLENPYLILNGQQVSIFDYNEDIHGAFSIFDTIGYDYERVSTTFFDTAIREAFGLTDVNENPFIETDSFSPDELEAAGGLDLFSAEDLYGSGSSFDNMIDVRYGYDHKGNLLNDQPAFEDFFGRDDQGYLNAAIGAFRPLYQAAYIQDKFTFRDLIFNIGVRVDRFDANTKVLRDPYSLYGTVKAGDERITSLLDGSDLPASIDEDFVVYVDDELNPKNITGYRNGNDWYNANGDFLRDPNILAAETGTVLPYLSDPLGDGNPGDDIKDPRFVDRLNTAFEDYEPQISVMPRIAFSFSLTDEATFFANYSVLTQRPQNGIQAFADNYYYWQEAGSSGVQNNPNLRPEKTIDYQLGFKQKVSRTSAISVSAFYREMRDMVQVIQVPFAYPITTYTTLGNVDFGTVKGFEFTYDLRRTGNVRLLANYTLQFAEGTGSDFLGASDQISAGQGNLRSIRPLSFDSRHLLTVTLDYRYGTGSKYDGPKIKDFELFGNMGLNLITRARSGTPYSRAEVPTPEGQFAVAGRTRLDGQINGSRLPWNYKLDMRIDRDIPLNFSKEGKASNRSLNLYVQIQNLLNTQNQLSAYAATGSGSDDGYLKSGNGIEDANNRTSTNSFQYLYGLKVNDPLNFSLPRTTRVGVIINF